MEWTFHQRHHECRHRDTIRRETGQKSFFFQTKYIPTVSHYHHYLVHQLRTGAKDEPKDEDQADEADENEDEPAQSEGEGGALDADDAGVSADANLLTDFQHKFEGALREPSRGLVVKDLMILFEGSSIYGRRAGFHKALMVTVPSFFTLSIKAQKKIGLLQHDSPSILRCTYVTPSYELTLWNWKLNSSGFFCSEVLTVRVIKICWHPCPSMDASLRHLQMPQATTFGKAQPGKGR